jgi:hypothetical protein
MKLQERSPGGAVISGMGTTGKREGDSEKAKVEKVEEGRENTSEEIDR